MKRNLFLLLAMLCFCYSSYCQEPVDISVKYRTQSDLKSFNSSKSRIDATAKASSFIKTVTKKGWYVARFNETTERFQVQGKTRRIYIITVLFERKVEIGKE